ncbi:hypothetical protein H9638_08420 [Arthrobacter sp. Sa2BUA2]|uniref:Uncharacterized protein n=1 Tax=Arthrobacter pullicola TaxID=2762224 RepID=A0ABR8YI82_9MICC|nr:hypothetical protein [Arthrobacter pullicola]MBD8043838.1 hypothetical protein [Arthrobacter pullicola]
MLPSRADAAAEEGFYPWPREIPAEWIRRAQPAILMVSALVLYHQFAPLPASPMGYVSEFFILSTAFSFLSARGRRKASPPKGPAQPGGPTPDS